MAALLLIDEIVSVTRLTYVNDKATLATVFTNILSSVQQNDTPIELSGDGYASRTFTVFMDTSKTINPDDRLIRTNGTHLRVVGVKKVDSGTEPYLEVSCEEDLG